MTARKPPKTSKRLSRPERGRDLDRKAWRAPQREDHDPATGLRLATFGDDRGTKESLNHRRLERVDTSIDNRPVTVTRVVTTLRDMHRNGTINDAEFRAGMVFKHNFDVAGLDGLHVPSWDRIPSSGWKPQPDQPTYILNARNRIYDMLALLGGQDAPTARAVYWVIGLEFSLNELERLTKVRKDTLKGFLISALYILSVEKRC